MIHVFGAYIINVHINFVLVLSGVNDGWHVWLQLVLHDDFSVLQQDNLERALKRAQRSRVLVDLEVHKVFEHFE